MSGLRAGEKPSRNLAWARPDPPTTAGAPVPALQGLRHIEHRQVEDRGELRQLDPVQSSGAARPAGQQEVGDRRQFGPAGERTGRILDRHGEGLDAEDVQPALCRAGAPPQVHQRQHVQARAEAQLADHEAAPAGPGLRQSAALQEDRAAFRKPVLAREIDVAETARARLAVGRPVQRAVVAHHLQTQRGPPLAERPSLTGSRVQSDD
jgi:hypothetical protein